MIVGERLRAVRESKQLSQGHIEKRTGLLRCYVSRVENGHTIPSIETLEKWSKALDISLSQLFAGDDETVKPIAGLQFKSRQTLDRGAMNGLRRIGAAFGKMNVRDRALVVAMATKFASAR